MLYKSTYSGPCEDSDHDPHHITMPFKHSEQLHREILQGEQFETDESFELEREEEDKMNGECIATQNKIIETMQRTISKMSKAMKHSNG